MWLSLLNFVIFREVHRSFLIPIYFLYLKLNDSQYQNRIKIIFQQISFKMQCKLYKYSKRGYISPFQGQILFGNTLCWQHNPIKKSRQIKRSRVSLNVNSNAKETCTMSSFIMAGSLLQSRITTSFEYITNCRTYVVCTYLLISSSENIFKMYSGHQYSWAFFVTCTRFYVRSRGSFFIQHNFPI